MRLCEAPHFNEDGPRHIPALAAAAQTPSLPQLLQPSPGPAAPQPRSPGRAQPSEDSTRRLPCAPPQRPRAASLHKSVRGLPSLGKGAAGKASRGVPGNAGVEDRAGAPLGPPPPRPLFLERRYPPGQPGPAGGCVCGRPRDCWHLPLLSGDTGLKTGSRANGSPQLFAVLLVEKESQGRGAGRGVCHCQNWPRSWDQVCA